MKLILTTIIALCITCAAYAEKGFRTIHFTISYPEKSGGLSQRIGSSPERGPNNNAGGEIRIDPDKSTLTITSVGTPTEVYTITEIKEESEDERRKSREQNVLVKDKAGKPFRLSIQRDYQYKTMAVYLFPDAGDTYMVYGCTYLKKLR